MNRACPVCGGKSGEVIRKIHMTLPEDLPLPSQYDVVSCVRCGFCYADTSATQEDYDAYYVNYNSYSEEEIGKSFESRFVRIREMLESHLDLTSRIVDFGFGNGNILLRLRAAGYQNLVGLDPSRETVEHGKERGIEAFQRNLYDDPGPLRERFDAVILTYVMEHLLHPKLGLQRAGSYLRDNGYLIVEFPDYSMCDHVNLPIPNQFNQEHINYFSDCSFANLLHGTGLQVVSAQSLPLDEGLRDSLEYGCLFLLQKCGGDPSAPASDFERDTKTKIHIERYLSRQESHGLELQRQIETLNRERTPLVIWGTGAFTMSLLASTVLDKCNIVAFADGNPLKVGTSILGMPVIAPEDVGCYPDAAILICAMKYGPQIRGKISELGLKNRVINLI